MPDKSRQKEIERNLKFFLGELPNLLGPHRGKFALIRHQEILGYYDTVADAVRAGNSLYPNRQYSVQQVTDQGTDLGYYSHAVPLGRT